MSLSSKKCEWWQNARVKMLIDLITALGVVATILTATRAALGQRAVVRRPQNPLLCSQRDRWNGPEMSRYGSDRAMEKGCKAYGFGCS
jgi:hypothetical protein